MPTVPQPRQSVGLEGLPSARVDPSAPLEAFGGGRANPGIDTQPLADQAKSIFEDEKRKADEVAQTNMGAQLSDLETKLTVATKQRMGSDAFGAPEDVSKAWNDATQKMQAGLTNDDQRIAFGRMAAMHWDALNSSVQNHVADQRRAYDGQVTDSYITNERNAGLVSGDPARVSLSIDNQRIAVAKHLQRIGAPQETVDQATAAVASTTHVAYISQLLGSGNDLAATQYFQANKGQIVGSQLGPIEHDLEAGSVLGEGQRRSDLITKDAPTLVTALDQAKDILDPKVREKAEELIRKRFSDVAESQYQQRVQANLRAGQVLDQTHDVDKIPRNDWDQLTPTEQEQMRVTEDRLKHPRTVTNMSVYTNLINQASLNEGTRQQFMATNFADPSWRDKLSEEDLKHVMNMQYELRTSGIRKDETAARVGDQATKRAEQALVFKQESDPKNSPAARATMEKTLPGSTKYLPPPVKVTVPQWMLDSAAKDPEYSTYLRMHGVPVAATHVTTPNAPNGKPTPARVPGGPLFQPNKQ